MSGGAEGDPEAQRDGALVDSSLRAALARLAAGIAPTRPAVRLVPQAAPAGAGAGRADAG